MPFLSSLTLSFGAIDAWIILLIYIIIFAIYYIALRKRISSIFDPLFYASASSALATAYMVILYTANLVDFRNFSWVISVTFLYYFGFLFGERFIASSSENEKPHLPPDKFVLISIFSLLLINQIFSYSIIGIPFLMESRLDQLKGGGGIGFISRVFDAILIPLLFITFYRLRFKRIDILSILIIFSTSAFLMLTGSKSSLLIIFSTKFIADINLSTDSNKKFRFNLLAIFLMISFALAAIFLQNQDEAIHNLIDGLTAFGVRALAYGDAYSYAYVGNVISEASVNNPLAIFQSFMQPLRMVSPDSLVVPGFELVKQVHGELNANKGPNPRLPVYIDFFYNRNLVFIAPLFGYILSRVRKLAFKTNMATSKRSIYIYAYFSLCAFETDPVLSLNGIFNALITFIILSIIYSMANLFRQTRERS